MSTSPALVLLRHGQSTLNAQDRFTGLLDPPLTAEGKSDAACAGALLAAREFCPAVVYTSTLLCTRDTARLVLRALVRPDTPVATAWELNERSYGALTGRARRELVCELGPEVFHLWRRSYYGAPPPMSGTQLGRIRRSEAFRGLPVEPIQPTESLSAVVKRVRTFWHQMLQPQLRGGRSVLVVGHGNSLRALCYVLDQLSEAEVEALNLPIGHPLLYRFMRIWRLW